MAVQGPVQVKPLDPFTEEQLSTFRAAITEHLEKWCEEVEVGTVKTIDQVLNCAPGCGCPGNGHKVSSCKGGRPQIPIEFVMGFLAPADGSPCPVKGVRVLSTEGPIVPVSKKAVYMGLSPELGLPRYLERFSG